VTLIRLAPPTCDPAVRQLIHQLAVRVVGPRVRDFEMCMASLVTRLNTEVNDFARHHNIDCSEGFNTLAEMRQAAEGRRAMMEHGFPAQVQPAVEDTETDEGYGHGV
jgi:hypothetical protein